MSMNPWCLLQLTEGRPCEDTLRRWPSVSQEERPHQNWIFQHLDLGLPELHSFEHTMYNARQQGSKHPVSALEELTVECEKEEKQTATTQRHEAYDWGVSCERGSTFVPVAPEERKQTRRLPCWDNEGLWQDFLTTTAPRQQNWLFCKAVATCPWRWDIDMQSRQPSLRGPTEWLLLWLAE